MTDQVREKLTQNFKLHKNGEIEENKFCETQHQISIWVIAASSIICLMRRWPMFVPCAGGNHLRLQTSANEASVMVWRHSHRCLSQSGQDYDFVSRQEWSPHPEQRNQLLTSNKNTNWWETPDLGQSPPFHHLWLRGEAQEVKVIYTT